MTPTALRARLVSGTEPSYHRLVSQGMIGVHGGRGVHGGVSGWELASQRTALWLAVAPVVEHVWAECAHRPRVRHQQGSAAASAEQVEAVLALAEAAELCSLAQSLDAARHYLLGDDGSRLHALACKAVGERVRFESIRGVSLEHVDAGHTATVVRVGLTFADRGPQWLALLVARDLGAAAARLGAQASDLRVWHRLGPSRAAEVFDDGTGRIRWFGQLRELPVVAARWVDGRAVRLRVDGAVLCDPSGTALAQSDAATVARRLAITRSALATFAIDGACERTLELEQGDVLATAGHEVVLVGSAARSWWGPLGAWPYRLAAATAAVPPSSSSSQQQPPAALVHMRDVVLAGLAMVRRRADGHELCSVMFHQARNVELARRALEGLVPARAREYVLSEVLTVLSHEHAAASLTTIEDQ